MLTIKESKMDVSDKFKPLTLLAIAVLAVATVLNWMWVWGLLYLYWAGAGALSGRAFIVEEIAQSENPALFWLINAMWVAAGIWTIITAI